LKNVAAPDPPIFNMISRYFSFFGLSGTISFFSHADQSFSLSSGCCVVDVVERDGNPFAYGPRGLCLTGVL
jgi:hypothetical protein